MDKRLTKMFGFLYDVISQSTNIASFVVIILFVLHFNGFINIISIVESVQRNSRAIFNRFLIKMISNDIKRSTQCTCHINTANILFRHGHVILEGVEIGNPPGWKTPYFLRIDRADVVVSVGQFFFSFFARLRINSITLQGVDCLHETQNNFSGRIYSASNIENIVTNNEKFISERFEFLQSPQPSDDESEISSGSGGEDDEVEEKFP